MAYKVDNDLEFLRELNDESLDNLVSILIKMKMEKLEQQRV
ncbi:DUF3944 domain-containing protein [Campylobacter coli]